MTHLPANFSLVTLSQPNIDGELGWNYFGEIVAQGYTSVAEAQQDAEARFGNEWANHVRITDMIAFTPEAKAYFAAQSRRDNDALLAILGA